MVYKIPIKKSVDFTQPAINTNQLMLNALLKKEINQQLGENYIIPEPVKALLNSISKHIDDKETECTLLSLQIKEQKENTAIFNQYTEQIDLLQRQSNEQIKDCMGLLLEMEGNSSSNNNPAGKNITDSLNNLFKEIQKQKERSEATHKRLFELENINKELDQFAYIVSHDLKAPLRAISNLSQWIEDDISELLNSQSKENLKLLRSRIYRMESLINAILTYSKSTKSKSQTEISDIGWLINEVIDSLNCPKNISITILGKFPVINTESIKLQQVFANLISNAIKYNNKEEGTIEIGFFETEDYYQFHVQDNGPGIEPQYQKKVFMIFQTLESKDDYESTGIGLAIVKKIIEEKGGKIWIESIKGNGAKFVFLWPKIKEEVFQKI